MTNDLLISALGFLLGLVIGLRISDVEHGRFG